MIDAREKIAKEIEIYADTLVCLANETELCYAYAKPADQPSTAHTAELNQHIAGLTVIIGAALAEVAKLQQISPVVLETLDALMPRSDKNHAYTLSQPTLLKQLADKIWVFQTLLSKVDGTPAELSKLDMSIQKEMKACADMIKTLEASPEFKNVENLANLKLLSQILEHGVALSADQESKSGPKGPRR